jgi:putative ABC transport system permease protein
MKLPLALRGLFWRRGISVAILVTAAVTTGAAALGPLYARAASESTLRDTLTHAASADSGLDFEATNLSEAPGGANVLARLGRAIATAPAPGSIRGYPTQIESVYWATSAAAPPIDALNTSLVWRSGECAHLRFVSGHCATGAHEAMVSARTVDFKQYGWKLGGALLVGGQAMKIVGVYQPKNIDDPFWFGQNYFNASTANRVGPDTVDTVFVAKPEIVALPGNTPVRVSLDYPLDPSAIRLANVPKLKADYDRIQAAQGPSSPLTLTSALPKVLASAAHQQQLVDTGTLLVTLQLTLLGWLVLFQVVSDAVESRGAEIALAKLRGQSPWSTIRFGLGEPIILLLVAIPIGGAFAILAANGFADSILVPGTPVQLTWPAGAAALAAFAGGAIAAGLAAGRVLVRPVLEQWRRTRSTRAHSRSAIVVDVIVAAAAVAGLVLLRILRPAGSANDTAALLAPGLLVMAVALIGTRLMPLVVRVALPLTRATTAISVFIATRQVVRRPAGLRLAALLAVALGLSTFAVGTEAAAVGNRTARAEAELGAATTVSIQYTPGVDPITAVKKADPGGTWAMATATWLPDGGNSVSGTVLAVDASRLAAVGYPARGGETNAELAKTISASTVPTIVLHATRLRATITASGMTPGSTPQVQFNLVSPLGAPVDVESTLLQPGTHDYAVTIPCTDGCTFAGITWDRPITTTGPITGSATISALGAGTGGGSLKPLAASLTKAGAWRAAPPAGSATDHVSASSAGTLDHFSSDLGGYGGVSYAYLPVPIPAVSTPLGLVSSSAGAKSLAVADAFGVTATFVPRRMVSVLPRVLNNGVLMNLTYLQRELPDFDNEAVWQIWLSPSAPADAVKRLSSAGLSVQSTARESTRVAELARQGPALSLLLLLASAIVGAVLAVGGTAISIGASARRRSFEAAALGTIGVSRRQLYRAALYEQGILLGTAVILGVVGGIAAAILTLPAIPEFATSTPVQLFYAPPPSAILLSTVGFVVLVLGAAAWSAAGVLRSAKAGRLREAEE